MAAKSGYLEEIRENWRQLLAATLGLSAGVGVAIYPQSVLAPYMLAEFGWTKAQFAMLGTISLLGLLFFPIAGRLIDIVGTRRIILPGILCYPLTWLCFAWMDGSIRMYIALIVLQLFIGALTTSVVYSKIVAEAFARSRGLALSIMMSGPAIIGALLTPLLTSFVEQAGWRSGYIAVSMVIALLGLAGFLVLPKDKLQGHVAPLRAKRSLDDYKQVFSHPAFWILFGGLALCNIPTAIHTSQMSLMLLDRGLGPETAALAVSVFAVGVIVGRFLSGIALDHLAPELVAAFAMSLPAIGLFLLALDLQIVPVVVCSMLLVGLSQGAEGDIGVYLTIKYFDVKIYGTVFSIVVSNTVIAMAVGATILSVTLERTGNFTLYLFIGAGSILAGSLVLLLLRGLKPAPVAIRLDDR